MAGAYGRIDWMIKLKTWKIIGYIKSERSGIKEIEIGRSTEKETALKILQDWYKENKMFTKYC